MSIARDGRDTGASHFYLDCLDRLRESHLERVLRGEKISPDYWKRGEADALVQTKQAHFTKTTRSFIMPPAKAAALNDDQDFDARNTKLLEMGMLQSHRILAQIPWVGHEEYRDKSAAPPS